MKNFTLILILSVIYANILFAQPVNNDCINPTTLTINSGTCTPTAYNNTGWTSSEVSTPGTGCASSSQNDFWFDFTPTGSTVTLDFGEIPNLEMYLTIRPNECGSVAGIYCSTITANTSYEVDGLTANTTYKIRISDESSSTEGNVFLCLTDCNLSADVDSTNITCNGDDDGTITITNPSGGGGSYEYTIDGGSSWETSGEFANLAPATYNVQMRDANNPACVKVLNGSLEITEPDVLSATVNSTNVSCNGGNDGAIDITVSGGTPNYNYSWTGPNGFSSTDEDISGLFAGTYNVLITDFANCTKDTSIVVSQPTNLAVETEPGYPHNVSCNGCDNGAIHITVSGGTPDYDYSWTGPNGFSSTDEDIDNLEAGTYYVTVTDDNDCEVMKNWTVNSYNCPPIYAPANITNVSCYGGNDGAIEITVSGGTPNYSYSWTSPNGFTSTNEDISGLIEGTYTVHITDSANCTKDTSIVVSQPAELSANVNSTNVSCNGGSNGKITISNASGGIGPYQYTVNAGANWDPNNIFLGLPAGTYNVQIKDENQCVKVLNNALVITEPPILSVNAGEDKTICSGTSTTLSASGSGGTPQYQYNWSNGQSGQTISVNPTITTTFTVTIKDNKNCQATDQVTVNVNPLPTVGPILGANSACKNSPQISLDGKPSGGSNSFIQHQWIGSGANHLTSPNVQKPYFRTNTEGTFQLQYRVKDSNGCYSKYSNQKIISIHQLPSANPQNPTPVCQKSPAIQLNGNPSAGTMPYKHRWIGKDKSKLDNTKIQHPKFNTDNYGDFELQYIVIDKNECTDTSNIVKVKINPKPEANYNVTRSNIEYTDVLAAKTRYYFNDLSDLKDNSTQPIDGYWKFTGIVSDSFDYTKSFNRVFQEIGDFNLELNVKNQYSCESNFKNSFTVSDKFEVSFSSDDTIFCTGETYLFEATVINPYDNKPVFFKWILDNDNNYPELEGLNEKTYYFSTDVAGIHELRLEAIDNEGNGESAYYSTTFIVNQQPSISPKINNMEICKSADSIFLPAQYKGTLNTNDKLVFLIDDDPNKEISSFNPAGYSGDITIYYYITNGGCETTHESFTITVKEIEPVVIDIINDDDKYCSGDTILVKTKEGWDWTPIGIDSLKNVGDTIIYFLLGESSSQSLEVYKKENGCTSDTILQLTVNPLPNIPSLSLPPLCNGSEDTLNISLNDNESIKWLNNNDGFIKSLGNSNNKYLFNPDTTKIFDYRIQNSETTCSADSFLLVDVIRIDPVIIPVDSCGDKYGSLFSLKPDSTFKNPDIIFWSVDSSIGTIEEGQNTKAIKIKYAENIKTDTINVNVNVNKKGCTGQGSYQFSSTADDKFQFLKKVEDTSVVYFQPCGAIIINKSDSCSNSYYAGYVDHQTGEIVRISTDNSYFVDTTRDNTSQRTYFVNCRDCDKTNIVDYRAVMEAIEAGCNKDNKNDLNIVLAPNPAIDKFFLYFQGKYKGNITIELYNSVGQKMTKKDFLKNSYKDKATLFTNYQAGVYYIKLYNNNGYLTSIPLIILNQ